MPPRSAVRPSCRLVVAFATCAIFAGAAAAAENVFADFAGAWSGAGTVTMANGQTRPMTCRSTYVVGASGTKLDQALDCTGEGTSLQLSASYSYASGGAISGNWSDASRGARGALAGQAQAGRITATVAGVGFVAGLGLNARGRQQSLTLQSQGAGDIKKVSINLRKV